MRKTSLAAGRQRDWMNPLLTAGSSSDNGSEAELTRQRVDPFGAVLVLPWEVPSHRLKGDTSCDMMLTTNSLKFKSNTHVGFSTSSLSISKACCHSPLKNGFDQRLGGEPAEEECLLVRTQSCSLKENTSVPVNHFIGGVLVEGVVESEGLVLQVTGQVNFLLGLMDHDHIFTGNGDHIQILHW